MTKGELSRELESSWEGRACLELDNTMNLLLSHLGAGRLGWTHTGRVRAPILNKTKWDFYRLQITASAFLSEHFFTMLSMIWDICLYCRVEPCLVDYCIFIYTAKVIAANHLITGNVHNCLISTYN